MRERHLVAAISAVAFLVSAQGAKAQRLAPVAVAAQPTAAPTSPEPDTAAKARGSRLPHMSRSAVIGVGVGAVLGLGWAAIAPTDGTGRSEKGMLFLGLGTLGAVAGLLIGSVIGALLPG